MPNPVGTKTVGIYKADASFLSARAGKMQEQRHDGKNVSIAEALRSALDEREKFKRENVALKKELSIFKKRVVA